MKTIKNTIVFILGLAALFLVVFIFYNGQRSAIQETSELSQEDLIIKGQYLAKAGDCAACHTSSKGDFAGGLGLDSGTPVGLIYPSNITPDKETGIGNYTLQDFDNAVRFGINKSGNTLYPAMPYPSYASVTSQDIEALYAYFMHDVKPVNNQVSAPSGDWPFTMNLPIKGWRLMFAPKVTDMTVSPDGSDELIRGAYLVQGLGHCGTCHTPRDATMAESALFDDETKAYLSGGSTMEGWNAVNLRGDDMDGLARMSKEELSELLKTGKNSTSAVFGSMVDVVNNSLQYLTDDDIDAVSVYLKSLSPYKTDGPKYVYDTSTYEQLSIGDVKKPGSLTYLDNCAGCHRSDGKGYAQTFPALAGNSVILNDNADSLISLILRGGHTSSTDESPTKYAMLGYSWRLDDEDTTELVNFLRNSWGNQARVINKSEVKHLRQHYIDDEALQYQRAQTNN